MESEATLASHSTKSAAPAQPFTPVQISVTMTVQTWTDSGALHQKKLLLEDIDEYLSEIGVHYTDRQVHHRTVSPERVTVPEGKARRMQFTFRVTAYEGSVSSDDMTSTIEEIAKAFGDFSPHVVDLTVD